MTDIQELILKGRPYLVEYLQENGIEFNKNGLFSCIHPDHDDSNPSCGIIPTSNGEEFHCLGCRRAGDIYTAAHYLENKPLHGPSFLSENLEYILNKYEVEHDKIELTEDQILDIKFTKVYDAAVNLMFDKNELGSYTHISFDHALSRGWTTKTCIELHIGSILDFNKYIADLSIKTDLTKDQLIDMGIDNKLFGPTKLTFTLRDHKGKVRGFVCRNMDFKKGGDIEKYCNTSEFRNPFYQKDKLLYGLNVARKYTGLRLDIFEGYGSYVTAYQAGHNRCVAMGGTAFTTDHAQLLYELGFRHINYVMDIDDTGIKLSNVYIERFSGFQGLKVTITRLPIPDADREKDPGANDADYFIKTYGLEAYRKIKTIGAFEHSLLTKAGNLVPESEEAVSFAKDTVKLIMNEENRIERGRMLKTLSETTGVPKEDLESEINRIQGSETTSIKNRLEKKLKNVNNAEQLETLLETGLEELSSTNNTKEDKYLISTAESVEVWDGIFADMNTQQQGIHGWRTGYQILDDRLDGLAKPNRGGVAIGFAGAPQHAKSAMMLNIVTQTVLNNNDVSVLYWAIDDNRKTIAYRLIAMLSGVHIKKVRNMLPRTEEDTIRIKAAQAQLVKWAEEKKLIIKDDLFGRSKKKAEHWITSFQNETGNQILFCIDSLNNIAGEDGAEMRSKMISNSGWAKSLTTRIPCTVLATMELVKNRTDEKPNLMSIAESGKLEYDFDAIAVVWNESQGKYGKIESCKAKWGSPGFWKPVIELDFQKNKCAAGEKGSVYFDFDPGTTALMNARLELLVTDSAPIEMKTKTGGTILISSESDVKPEKHAVKLKI